MSYIVQNVKNKRTISKHTTFEAAMLKAQSMDVNEDLVIVALEIVDGYNNRIKLYNNEVLYKIIDTVGVCRYMEIDGGRWLKREGCGKCHLLGNQNVKYTEVSMNCYNIIGDVIHNRLIGYVKI